jgi:hypothetical protein
MTTITNIKKENGGDRIFLSCGDNFKAVARSMHETVHVSDSVSVVKRLFNSATIKIESKIPGSIPVTVSGDAGIKFDTSFPNLTFHNTNGNFVLNNPTFYFNSVRTEEHKTDNTIILNDIDNVIAQVDANNHSPQEKEEIKKMLNEFNTEIKDKPLKTVVSNLKEKFRTYFPMGSEYLKILFAHYLNTPPSG